MKILTSDNSIARFCVQGIEVFTLEEHSGTPYLQSKKELSSGHTMAYGYFEKTDVGRRICVQRIEVYTLDEHGRTPYAQCKKGLSSGHTLEYAGVARRYVTRQDDGLMMSTSNGHIKSGNANGRPSYQGSTSVLHVWLRRRGTPTS